MWGARRRLPHWGGSSRTLPPSRTPTTIPHPHIPAHLLVPRHPCHPGRHLPSVRTPHSGPQAPDLPYSVPSSRPPPMPLPSHPGPRRTFTRKAGGGVDPREQQPRAQLAAGVGVSQLDGLAHLRLAGRPLLRGWAVRRPPISKGYRRRCGPGPESRPCRPPGPARCTWG